MPKKKRRSFSSAFKAKVGLEALAGFKTVGQIARENKLHANQVSQWKRELKERLPQVFDKPSGEADDRDELIQELYGKVGQLTIELEWLQKKAKALGL
jgi:transposase-like protein